MSGEQPHTGTPTGKITFGEMMRVLRACAAERQRMGEMHHLSGSIYQARALDAAHNVILAVLQNYDVVMPILRRQKQGGRAR